MVLNIFYKLWLQRTPQQTAHHRGNFLLLGLPQIIEAILIHPVSKEHWPDYADIAWVLSI